jgi:hypothetical protein
MGEIVGTISLDDEGKPFFTVVKQYAFKSQIGPNVRPCEHRRFTLDEKWSTVTCQDCGERIDPFAALLYFCERWEDFERKRQQFIEARKRLYIASLQRLRKRVKLTPEERAEVDALLKRQWSATLEELVEVDTRLERRLYERR